MSVISKVNFPSLLPIGKYALSSSASCDSQGLPGHNWTISPKGCCLRAQTKQQNCDIKVKDPPAQELQEMFFMQTVILRTTEESKKSVLNAPSLLFLISPLYFHGKKRKSRLPLHLISYYFGFALSPVFSFCKAVCHERQRGVLTIPRTHSVHCFQV